MTRRIILALLFAVFAVPAAFAQAQFTDSELDAFAEAYTEIETIRAAQADELAIVEDPTEAQDIQERTQTRIDDVLSSAGLSAERYNEILAAIERDPELAEDVMTRVHTRHDP